MKTREELINELKSNEELNDKIEKTGVKLTDRDGKISISKEMRDDYGGIRGYSISVDKITGEYKFHGGIYYDQPATLFFDISIVMAIRDLSKNIKEIYANENRDAAYSIGYELNKNGIRYIGESSARDDAVQELIEELKDWQFQSKKLNDDELYFYQQIYTGDAEQNEQVEKQGFIVNTKIGTLTLAQDKDSGSQIDLHIDKYASILVKFKAKIKAINKRIHDKHDSGLDKEFAEAYKTMLDNQEKQVATDKENEVNPKGGDAQNDRQRIYQNG